MKNVVIIIIGLLSLSLKAQYTLDTHPLYSDVWVIKNNGNNNILTPKYGSLQFKVDHIKNAVDVDKIKNYLLSSYNQFRSDYGLAPVTEDVKMSKDANTYSSTLVGKPLVHSKGNYSECLGNVKYMSLSHLDPNKVDINKVIADSYFDAFVGCPAHMAILLKQDVSVAGFGITQDNGGFVLCVRNH
jgi:hypothetical protein